MTRAAFQHLALALGLAALVSQTGIAAARAQTSHHEIMLALDPQQGAIHVHDQIRVSGDESITLALAAWLEIIKVRIDGRDAELAVGRPLTLSLPGKGDHRIDITAAGAIPRAATPSG